MDIIPITVCTATIPPRYLLLGRAVESVYQQTFKPERHIISVDHNHNGGPATLDSAIAGAGTDYVATLDDDDEWMPHHLETLWTIAQETDADLVFTHFRYSSTGDGGHLEQFRGQVWDNANPRQTTNVFLVKYDAWAAVGGFCGDFDPESYEVDWQGNRIGYDFNFVKKLAARDAHIVHSPEVTWTYHVAHGSTLGMPNRW